VNIKIILLFLTTLTPFFLFSQSSIISWNIRDFGRTKTTIELQEIANTIKDVDLVAVQEVVAVDPAGAQKVAVLADILNRTGAKWDYRVSDKTTSPGRRGERYAYLWKTSKLQLIGRPFLEKKHEPIIFREPYMARFKSKEGIFLIANYHARNYREMPEEEIDLLLQLNKEYPEDNVIIAGDFNKYSDDKYFSRLRSQEYELCPKGEKTTLKTSCKSGSYFNHPIDFFIYEKAEFEILSSGAIDFVGECSRIEIARSISDHLPVFINFHLN